MSTTSNNIVVHRVQDDTKITENAKHERPGTKCSITT